LATLTGIGYSGSVVTLSWSGVAANGSSTVHVRYEPTSATIPLRRVSAVGDLIEAFPWLSSTVNMMVPIAHTGITGVASPSQLIDAGEAITIGVRGIVSVPAGGTITDVRWQQHNGATWTNISVGTPATSSTLATLAIGGGELSTAGTTTQFRVIATSTSDVATPSVLSAVVVATINVTTRGAEGQLMNDITGPDGLLDTIFSGPLNNTDARDEIRDLGTVFTAAGLTDLGTILSAIPNGATGAINAALLDLRNNGVGAQEFLDFVVAMEAWEALKAVDTSGMTGLQLLAHNIEVADAVQDVYDAVNALGTAMNFGTIIP
jgi:hypothetical protein